MKGCIINIVVLTVALMATTSFYGQNNSNNAAQISLLKSRAAAIVVDSLSQDTLGVMEKGGAEPQRRKRVGLVLSGGGAKGVAHIGAIKVIEEAGIPIDYITGTSMGAIVGGLYAIGYDTHTLDSMVRSQNWIALLSDRVERAKLSFGEKEYREKYIITVPLSSAKKIEASGLVAGHNVYNLLTELTIGYHDSLSFESFPIPFACVAYDLASGKTKTLNAGVLPQAIRASMSIPGAFEPVRVDSMVLIDGGIANNFPADVIKDMGAEIIIGVDVGATVRDAGEIKSVADMFNQITYFTGEEAYERNLKLVDLYVHPKMEPYNAGSFNASAIDSLLVRGEEGMRGSWDELIALKEKIGIAPDSKLPAKDTIDVNRSFRVKHIYYEGAKYTKQKTLERTAGLKEYSILTSADIKEAVERLQGLGALSEVHYKLEGDDIYNLIFTVKEASRNSLSLGLRFDSEEMAALLLNGTIATKNMGNSHFDITARLSENPYIKGGYVLGNPAERRFSISYMFKDNNVNLYERGDKYSNFDFGLHVVDVNYSNIQVRNFKVGVGVKYEFYDYRSMLSVPDADIKTKSEGFVNYYLEARYESFDRRYNPRQGQSFKVDYMFHTSNFATYRGSRPYSSIQFDYQAALSVSSRVAFLPGIFGRLLIGEDFALSSKTYIGGTYPGRYMAQQMPFVGVRRIEMIDNAVLGARLDLRVRLWTKNFVALKTNYAKTDNKFFDLDKGRDLFGVGLSYSYNSIIGPLEVLVDWSNYTKKVGFYFNLGYYF